MIDEMKIKMAIFDSYIQNYDKYIGFSEELGPEFEAGETVRNYINTDGISTRFHSLSKATVYFQDIPIAVYDYGSIPSLENLNLVKEITDEGYFDDMRKPLYQEDYDRLGVIIRDFNSTVKNFGISPVNIEFDVLVEYVNNYDIFRVDGIFDKEFDSGAKDYDNNDDPREIKVIVKYFNGDDYPQYVETYYDIRFGDIIYKKYNIFIFDTNQSFDIIEQISGDNHFIKTISSNRYIFYNLKDQTQITKIQKIKDLSIICKKTGNRLSYNIINKKSNGETVVDPDNAIFKNIDPTFYNCFGVPIPLFWRTNKIIQK